MTANSREHDIIGKGTEPNIVSFKLSRREQKPVDLVARVHHARLRRALGQASTQNLYGPCVPEISDTPRPTRGHLRIV